MNSKNIAIDDAVGKIRIPKYGFCNTPVRSIRLDDEQIITVMHLYKGPKCVYAVNPNDSSIRVKLTDMNYNLSENELFGLNEVKIEEAAIEPVIEEIKETDTMTLADLPTPPAAKEPEVIEEIVVPVETAPVIEEVVVPVEVVEPVIEESAPVVDKQPEDDDFDDLKAETTTTPESESVKEVPMKESEKKPQQNQYKPNNNYNHNNNNNGQKKKYTYNGGNNNKH